MLQPNNAHQSRKPDYEYSYTQARQVSAVENCIMLSSEQLMTVPKQKVQINSIHFK